MHSQLWTLAASSRSPQHGMPDYSACRDKMANKLSSLNQELGKDYFYHKEHLIIVTAGPQFERERTEHAEHAEPGIVSLDCWPFFRCHPQRRAGKSCRELSAQELLRDNLYEFSKYNREASPVT